MLAHIAGFVGAGTGIVALLFGIYNFRKQRNAKRNQDRWDEYQQTTYNPLLSALDGVGEFAAYCRDIGNSQAAQGPPRTFAGRLSSRMNDLEIACEKADEHHNSLRNDWSDHADSEGRKIYDFIDRHNVDIDDIANNRELALSLNEVIQEYLRPFRYRLRKQREYILKY